MEHVHFVHLHVKSEFSLLEGMCRIPDMVQRAYELKMPALALTDHGNLFGAAQFYRQCMAVGIKPILGCELYVAIGGMEERQKGAKRRYHHLVVLAKDDTGWGNLMRLASDAYTKGFYYKPRTDKAHLREHGAGLIALSCGMRGEIGSALKEQHTDAAEAAALEYVDIFGPEHFYLELQDHGGATQRLVNERTAELGAKLGIPLVATNDVHYVDREHAAAHDVLITLGQNTTLDDPKRWRMEDTEHYLKGYDDMAAAFAAYPDAVQNTVEIATRCNVALEFGTFHLPKYHVPDGETDVTHLRALCEAGLEWRYGTRDVDTPIRDRLEHELHIIERMGYASYFLVVYDFVHEARERRIPVGPGRGSAAGSVVSYLLGITGLDPLRNGLIFERFLNPERISMPDIDIDFCYERRGEIIDYVTQKYGADCVSQIITFGQMKAKAVIRDVGRVMGMPFSDVDTLAKLVPNELNITLTDALAKEPDLQALREQDPEIAQLMEYALQLEGLARHASTHAAGVVICEEPLTTYVPLFRHAASGDITTQFPMGDLEDMGLLKMDFLGLRTLTVMEHAVESVRERLGIDIDLDKLPLDDAATYAMLSRAECIGVFQMESSGMRDLARKVGLDKFEDVVALVALFRPGPMNMLPDYISRKHGHTPVEYGDARLESVLRETHGIMLYQEQVMQIAVTLAGFTMAEADTLRKAMGKKLPEVMQKMERRFVDGAVENACDPPVAEKIWNDIVQFAGYGFNKSHSAAYGLIAYQTAWLKCHYPTDFMAALLTSEISNTDKVVQYIAEAQRMGITVDAPDVNESARRFRVCDDTTIRFGLAAVKNVGDGAIESIVAERDANGPYSTLYDFCRRVDMRHVNRRVMESLVKAGAFDSFGRSRRQLEATLDRAMQAGQVTQRDRAVGQTSLLDMLSADDAATQQAAEEVYEGEAGEWPEHELLQNEKEVLGLYVAGHPLGKYADTLERYCSTNAGTLQEQGPGDLVTVGGLILGVKTIFTRKGDRMAFVELEDLVGTIEVTVFSDVYAESAALLETDGLVIVKGHVDERDGELKLIARQIVAIEDAATQLTTAVHVQLLTAGLEAAAVDALYQELSRFRDQNGCELVFHLRTPALEADVEIPRKFRVAPSPDLVHTVSRLVGEDGVWLTGQTAPIRSAPSESFGARVR